MKKIFDLENLIYITIIILPVYLIKIKFYDFSINVLEIFILIILIGWIFKKGYKTISLESYEKLFIPMGLIFAGLVFSAVFNKNFLSEAGIIKGWFFFPIVFVFLASQIIKKNKISNVFKAIYLSSFLVSIIAITFLLLGKVTYDGRLEAFFNSPNYLSMCVAPALIIFSQYRIIKTKYFNFFVLASGAVIFITLYFTYSYATWIAVAASLIIVEIVNRKKFKFEKKIWLSIFILVIFFIFQLKETKFVNLVDYNSRSSLASRFIIWQSAGKILKDNLILGIGPGNFQEKYLEYQKYYPPYLEWAVPHPHNLYMTFWLSGGILSLVGFVWINIVWFKEIMKKKESLVRSFALGIMFYILIHGILDTTYFKNDLAIIFWLNFLALKL